MEGLGGMWLTPRAESCQTLAVVRVPRVSSTTSRPALSTPRSSLLAQSSSARSMRRRQRRAARSALSSSSSAILIVSAGSSSGEARCTALTLATLLELPDAIARNSIAVFDLTTSEGIGNTVGAAPMHSGARHGHQCSDLSKGSARKRCAAKSMNARRLARAMRPATCTRCTGIGSGSNSSSTICSRPASTSAST